MDEASTDSHTAARGNAPEARITTLRLTHERTDHVGARQCRHQDRACEPALAYRSAAHLGPRVSKRGPTPAGPGPGALWRALSISNWRKGWDSNPRGALAPGGFQDRCLKPLGHPSAEESSIAYYDRLGQHLGNCHRIATGHPQREASLRPGRRSCRCRADNFDRRMAVARAVALMRT